MLGIYITTKGRQILLDTLINQNKYGRRPIEIKKLSRECFVQAGKVKLKNNIQ